MMNRILRGLASLLLIVTVTVCVASTATPCPKSTLHLVPGNSLTPGLVSSFLTAAIGLGLSVAQGTTGPSFSVSPAGFPLLPPNQRYAHKRLHLLNRVFLL